MSRDTDFKLVFSAPSSDVLSDVISYLARKKDRLSAWERRGKSTTELMRRVGTKYPAAVVSWGFRFGDIKVHKSGHASVKATAWANQNFNNVHISGEGGELADLLEKFPGLEIGGTYKAEGGERGEIVGYDEC